MKPRKGFTLIEILIVISIIGLLVSIISINTVRAKHSANYSRSVADLELVASSVSMFRTLYGAYPKDGNCCSGTLTGAPGVGLNLANPSYAQSVEDAANFIKLLNWPKPPCPGWFYDWENWDDDNVDQFARTYRISLRKSDSKALFYLCISSDDPKCMGNGSEWVVGPKAFYSNAGGENILTTPDKAISCRE